MWIIINIVDGIRYRSTYSKGSQEEMFEKARLHSGEAVHLYDLNTSSGMPECCYASTRRPANG